MPYLIYIGGWRIAGTTEDTNGRIVGMSEQFEYDPAQQLNVLQDGTPVIDTADVVGPTMTHRSGDNHPPVQDDA